MNGKVQWENSSLDLEESVESDRNILNDFVPEGAEDFWHDGAFARVRSYRTSKPNSTSIPMKGVMKEIKQDIQPLDEGTLPRRPIPIDVAAELLDTDELEAVEAILRTHILADNKEYARIDSIYRFLEQFLLPRMRLDESLTGKELIGEAYEYRKAFKRQNPNDFDGSFQFLPSVGLALTQLQLYYGINEQPIASGNEVATLVQKAATIFGQLIEEDATAIYYP